MVVVMGVGMVRMIGVIREFVMDVKAVLEVAELFIEPLSFHAVSDAVQPFVLVLDFGNNSMLICLELMVPFVVMVVLLNFCKGSGVAESTGLFSQ